MIDQIKKERIFIIFPLAISLPDLFYPIFGHQDVQPLGAVDFVKNVVVFV